MTHSIRPVPEIRTGIYDSILARNGDIADGAALAVLGNQAFALMLRRGVVRYKRFAAPTQPFTAGTTHRSMFYAYHETDLSGLFCTVLLGDSGVVGRAGFATFAVNGTSELSNIPDFANTATASAGPSAFRTYSFKLQNAALGANTLSWSVDSNSAIVGVVIYSAITQTSSTFATLAGVSSFKAGSICDVTDFKSALLNTWDHWKYHSTSHFTWDGSASQTGTTWKNVLDGSTAGFSSTAAGFLSIPEKQATRFDLTVAAKFGCYASTDIGSTGRVRLVNSSGTLGTITGIGVFGGYFEIDVVLDPAKTSSDLVIVEVSNATAGQTTTVNGAWLYNLGS